MKYFSAAAVYLISFYASANMPIEGKLLERGTKTPLAEVNIYILPHKLKATTDQDGNFRFPSVPEGEFEWVVNIAGYHKLQQSDQLGVNTSNSNSLQRSLYMEKSTYGALETTVYGKLDRRDDSLKSLKASQFLTAPGAGGDPIKAVQNLPGVNRSAPFSSQVIIQGAAPQDTRYSIDGHEVPIIFHFGGLSSVVVPEALDRVDYLSAGYGPEHGRAIGGLIDVETRSPKRDRLQGFGFVDIFNAGFMLEGPAGQNGSWLIGGRQSYIGEVFKLIAKNNSDFNLTVAPTFSDALAMYETDITPIDKFKFVTVGSLDTLQFVLAQPSGGDPSLRGTFYDRTAFIRFIPELVHKHSENTTSRLSLGFGRDWVKVDIGQDYFYLQSYNLTTRAELEKKITPNWTSQWGMDHRFTWADVSIQVPDVFSQGGVFSPFSSATRKQTTISNHYDLLGAYWRNEIQLADTPWTLLPSVRTDYYNVTKEFLPLPRMGARYKLDESLSLKASTGLYAQPPQEGEIDPVFGNPKLHSPKAWHFTLGVDKDFREGSSRGFVLNSDLFYKQLDSQVIQVPSQQRYTNDGKGKVYGLENLLKLEFAPISGWISYTLSRSTRWDPAHSEYVFTYDQTHLFTAVATYEQPHNWKISARARYATGNPKTPITGGIFDADNDVYNPRRGPIYSERLEPFFQVDLRLDKKWIYDRWILSLYLDFQNLTNRQNLEQVRYSYDYSSNTKVAGLPFLPTFGLKAEF